MFALPCYQWRNGLAENHVKILKRFLETTLFKNNHNYTELQALLTECVNTMNDHPVAIHFLTKEDYIPVTIHQLLLGRTSTGDRD